MATFLTAQITMPFGPFLPEDVAINTWHFYSPVDGSTADDVMAYWSGAIDSFYTDPHGAAPKPVGAFLGGHVSRTAATRKWYATLEDGPPIREEMQLLAATTITQVTMPNEVAVCLSFQGEYEGIPGENLKRRKGRLYIGPLSTDAASTVQSNIEGGNRPDSDIILSLKESALFMANAHTLPGWEPVNGVWCTYSPTMFQAGLGPLASHARVVGGWIDNEWDTQRRRGGRPTQRNPWEAAAIDPLP